MEEEKTITPQRAAAGYHICNHPCRSCIQLLHHQALHHLGQGICQGTLGQHPGWKEALTPKSITITKMGKSIKIIFEISFDTAKPQYQRNLKDYKVV